MEHFDAVVVGSGFGGSVLAQRLSKAGMSVCVLERGRSIAPGEFPRAPHEMRHAFWDPSEGHYGMFDIWSFKKIDAVVASGLGGGSLIYANVLLRKPAEWFESLSASMPAWPLRYEDLAPHYDRVEAMLGVQRYPLEHEPYASTAKTRAMQAAAKDMDLPFELPNLAVTFANPNEGPRPGEPIVEPAPNLHGKTRLTCTLCGECDIGCNQGSKNTLDLTYLSAAARAGADIRTLAEVRSLDWTWHDETEGNRTYVVRYVQHDLRFEGRERDTRSMDLQEIHADRLVLAAGTLGTNFLLFKNSKRFEALKPQLGRGFSGNGDFLGLVRRPRWRWPWSPKARDLEPTRGPVITSAIRVDRYPREPLGFLVQDAGIPAFGAWLVEVADLLSPRRLLSRIWHFLQDRSRRWTGRSNVSGRAARMIGQADLSRQSMPLLGMGMDLPTGRLSMSGKRLQNDWTHCPSWDHFQALKETMQRIARSWGATYRDQPLKRLFGRDVTAHPLGGCPMSASPDEGVVDAWGEMWHYPGAYVVDGSVMPSAIGVNPSLTIAAFADRCADRIIERWEDMGTATANPTDSDEGDAS